MSFFGKHALPTPRRRSTIVRIPGLRSEPLERRALMALISSVTFDLKGQEIADYVVNTPGYHDGQFDVTYTPGYVRSGPLPVYGFDTGLTTSQPDGLRSVSTAYDKAGDILQDFVDNSGTATQSMSYVGGQQAQIVLGPGVESMSVAFEPDGTGVSDVVYEDGSYYEFTSTGGSTLVATNVVSASVAIDSRGNKLQDYVTADAVLHEIGGGTTTTLGTNVASSGVAFDGNDGVVRSVVFTDGSAYQYDYAGAHESPAPLFTPVTQPYLGSTGIAFDPTTAEEYALASFPRSLSAGYFFPFGDLYQYNSSGVAYLGGFIDTANTAFSKGGKIIQDVVQSDGKAYEYINGGPANFLGSGVQSVSIAFDPSGNEVADVVYWDGEYYEFDSQGGSTLIASNVVSASVAIDSKGDKLQDYVTADGVAREISGGTTTTLGTNVVGISVAYDGNGGIARSVLFTNGLAYQYDYAGQHLQGQVFNPFQYNPKRLAFASRFPSI